MLLLYDLGIRLYRLLIGLVAFKNKKAAAWINGRRNILSQIKSQIKPSTNRIWFHFASLGEFEQGRPVLEEIKLNYPNVSIIITFFSPSGYEIRKNYELADNVFYLPLDTRNTAKEFISIIKPSIAVFTKYEYWYHYFEQLKNQGIPLFIVSGLFRNDQTFFKWYGGLHRKMLRMVSHFFVQNELSETLLASLGLINVTVTGDTRFDRVVKNSQQTSQIKEVATFSKEQKIFIAGSTWPADEVLLSSLAKNNPDWKFIIAPHEVNPEHIQQVENLFSGSVKFSDLKSVSDAQVLIIDNIGMLSSLYQYGDIAYIGGGFGVGIHNTQEAAAFSLPVIFGPNYHKFQEAKDLIELEAAFSIRTNEDLSKTMDYLRNNETRLRAGTIAKDYILNKAGATGMIIKYLKEKDFLN